VSVSERSSTPPSSSSERSRAKFSMMPLWMTATRPPVGGGVRVRVAVVGGAVGGPAGVPDAGGGGAEAVGAALPFGEGLLQVAELAGALLGQYR
jgi:hypothetical protein